MKTLRMMVVAMAAMCVWLATPVFTAGPTFRADYRFTRYGADRLQAGGFGRLEGAERRDRRNGERRQRRLAAARRQGISGHADVRERQVRRRLQGRVRDARRKDTGWRHEGRAHVGDRK